MLYTRIDMQIQAKAVLFDLDGTLVNSTHCVEAHWRQWAARRGFDAEKILQISHGRPTVDTIRLVAPELNAPAEAHTLDSQQAIDLTGVVAAPNAIELVSNLPEECWAIVTSGNRAIASNRLRHVGLAIPRVLITLDDVSRFKPHPEGYWKAAEQLNVAPDNCVVVEDAPVGIRAGHRAGMTVIAVAATYPVKSLGDADYCISGLQDLLIQHTQEGGLEIVLRNNRSSDEA